MRSGIGMVLVLLGLAACGGSDPVLPDRLTPADVQGAYRVCEIAFSPEGTTLPTVDVVTAAFELDEPDVRRPQLNIDPDGTVQLEFTRKGFFTSSEIRGTIPSTIGDEIRVRLQPGEIAPSSLLMPNEFRLTYDAGSRSLTQAATAMFTVPRSSYAELAGVSESNLAESIRGSLSLGFRVGTCG